MIVGSMVVKNEADRYLQASLTRLKEVCDQVFVFDDNSTDNSVELADSLGAVVVRKPKDCPGFLEDESAFRQCAWQTMGHEFRLDSLDWVISVDADEYFLGDVAYLHGTRRIDCFKIRVPEVWSLDPVRIRVDGYWNQNYNCRIGRYRDNLRFNPKKMGCGSLPNGYTSVLSTEGRGGPGDLMEILHFGYAEESDRLARYNRYTSLPDHGHNPKHIESIITKPILEEIDAVDFWKGVR